LLITHLLFGSEEDFEGALQTCIANNQGHAVNVFGQSAVHLAVHSPSRLRRLLLAGMDPDANDRGLTTPLMYAAAYGRLDSVITLMQHGSRLDFQDELNSRCFVQYAIRFKHIDLIRGLVGWLRDEGYAEVALWVLDCSVNCQIVWAAECCLHFDIPMLEALFELGGDPDTVDCNKNTAMHLVSDAEHAEVLLKHNFTAAGVQNKDGKTALMHITRFFNPCLTEQLLYRQSDAGILIDQRDSSHWSAMIHLVGQSRRFARWPDTTEARFQHKTNDTGCMNLLLRHGADVLLTDNCRCPCSPGGCSAMSVALHHALEGTRLESYNSVLNTLPIDLTIAVTLLACSDDRLRQLADTVAAFSDYIQSGEKHSCCALGTVRPLLMCTINGAHVTDSQTRVTERPEVRNSVEGVTDEKARLTHQLARFYTLLELRSRARYEDQLASRIKTVLDGSKRPRDGKHHSSVRFGYLPELLRPQRLDLQDYRAWISDCEMRTSRLHSGMSLEAWVKNALELVGGLDREMERLKVGRS
jgi:ankyrin repeat protein